MPLLSKVDRLWSVTPTVVLDIYRGNSCPGSADRCIVQRRPPRLNGLGWRQGNVVGIYIHGLLDNGSYRQWFLEQFGWQGRAEDWGVAIDAAIDQVAALVTESGWAEQLERSMDR